MKSETKYLQGFKEYMVLKNYSIQTLRSYESCVKGFFNYCKNHKEANFSFHNYVQRYLLFLREKGLAWATINANYSALKILYVHVLKGQWEVENLPRPKMPKYIPRILSPQEVVSLIEAPKSFKHRVIIAFLYATGLRISEALNIKVSDIDSDRLEIFVSQGKGHKDRLVSLSEKLLQILRQYYLVYKPQNYLFTGLSCSGKYSKSSVRKILLSAKIKAKISKPVSPHTLRHCYATHHLENGTDLVYLKEQLGHNNIKTTAKYIHLCGHRQRHIIHPIDIMQINIDKTIPSENSCATMGSNT